MEEDAMGMPAVQPDRNRRTLLKTTLGVPMLSVGMVSASIAKPAIYWVHGNSATIVGAPELEMDVVQGSARIVRGRSWSTIPLYFAIPSKGGQPWRHLRIFNR